MTNDYNNGPRWTNLVLGIWLFISAFIWTHTPAQFYNAWIVGIVSVIIAAIAMRVPQLRYINALLAIWLFISAWALPTRMLGTFWNHLILGVVMFAVAMTPTQTGGGRLTPGRTVPMHR